MCYRVLKIELQSERMPGNQYNDRGAIRTSRVERLLRERELWRISRTSQWIEPNDNFDHDQEGDNTGVSAEEDLDGAVADWSANEGGENQDGRPARQRLLVVANRLPVSAIRRGEESWSLEISAGGLVSALLVFGIGWAGVNVPDEIGQRALTEALAEKDRSLDFHALCALYAVTDIALVTSLRDGMNLVSYEFVACQDAKKGVLILSEFAGAAQSLGAGAILVNPWNITVVASSIGQALNMSPEEREKRHNHNFAHVTTHTAQEWAEMFVSELNDTVVEARLRTKQVPPQLQVSDATERYLQSNNRLLILGFNATVTEPVDTPGRRGDQIKEMELKLHPDLKEPLIKLCSDPSTTVVVLSGSDRAVLDENFGEFNMWLAAENGMFLRNTRGDWMTTMPEHLNVEWVDSVKHVFEYFTERTPRSHFELRETSLVWNYKYADVEFGRLQARDMLQHIWTGPISNTSVDVVQGGRSVEVREVGVTKGAAIDRILGEIVHSKSMSTPIDYVLCIGHFLGKDEDVYSFFEPDLPTDSVGIPRSKTTETLKLQWERRSLLKLSQNNRGSKSSHGKRGNVTNGASRRPSPEKVSWNVLDLKKENYFSCSVGRTRTKARFILSSSNDVVSFLKQMADSVC